MDATDKLRAITRLGLELNEIKDIDILMERILTEARRFVNADAGSIYIREGEVLHFNYTQNETLQARLQPGKKLVYSRFTLPINNESIAGYAANTGQTVNIPDVYQLPTNLPYRFSRNFDEQAGYRTQSVLTVSLRTGRGDNIGVLQIINASDGEGTVVPFTEEDDQMLTHFSSLTAVALERAQMTRHMILRMIRMAELRDPKETGVHVTRVGAISVELYEHWARQKSIDEKEILRQRDVLRMAAMLHDVGKVGIADAILKKPGRFTPEEFAVMKLHSWYGARLFKDGRSEFDEAALDVALNHHERWDGKGYPGHINIETGEALEGYIDAEGKPRGKSAIEIPLFGRIVAIADVYDALLSKRVYKEAWSEEDTLRIMKEGRGTQFDPELIDVFFNCIEALRSIRQQYGG